MALVVTKRASTPIKTQPEFYSDFTSNLDFNLLKKDLIVEVNAEAVKTSIKNMLLTNPGERFFNNNFGGGLRDLLFENITPPMLSIIEDRIKTSIKNFEPRAKVLDVNVSSEYDDNTLVATIVFSIINKQEPITLDIILNRVR